MKFSEIIGKTLESVDHDDSERIVFYFTDGTACESYHSHDCCESVDLQRIEGDLALVIGMPILDADEFNPDLPPPKNAESYTWTTQRIRTAEGEVAFVWLGESNGYYGEKPYFRITHGKKV